MADFDAIKALKEEIAGLVDVKLSLRRRVREVETKFGELETELNALKKLSGFADVVLDKKLSDLKHLETPV